MFFFLPIVGVFSILGAMVYDQARTVKDIESLRRRTSGLRAETLDLLEDALSQSEAAVDISRSSEVRLIQSLRATTDVKKRGEIKDLLENERLFQGEMLGKISDLKLQMTEIRNKPNPE
jgi:hypothetical protein